MKELNRREVLGEPSKKKVSILVEFPDPHLEAVIVQWEGYPPSVLVQLKKNPDEPLQFQKRKDMAAGERPETVIDLPLQDFIDPTNGLIFGKNAFLADILFSMKAFLSIQPEPDLVLPVDSLWECRAEALRAMSIADQTGIAEAPSLQA